MSDARETAKITVCSRLRMEIEAIPLAKVLPEPVRSQIVPLCMTGLDVAENNGMLPAKKHVPPQRRGRD